MHNIAIVQLGFIKHKIDFYKLKNWSSEIFRICDLVECRNIPNGRADWQTFTDRDLRSLIQPVNGVDFTVAITEYALEGNFFIRRVSDNRVTISLNYVADILESEHIPIENFILRNLYELALIYEQSRESIPTSEYIPEIIHHETRSCLFDMCGVVADIRYSSARPSLCDECRAILGRKQLHAGVIGYVDNELRKIRKPLYYCIDDFIKQHPFLYTALTIGGGFVLGFTTNACYDLVKNIFLKSN